jgi:hypothetical protein
MGIRAKEANTDSVKPAKMSPKVSALADKRLWTIKISSELPISSAREKIRRGEKLKLVVEGTENERRRENARRRGSARTRESARRRESEKFSEPKRNRNRSPTLRTKGEKLWLV